MIAGQGSLLEDARVRFGSGGGAKLAAIQCLFVFSMVCFLVPRLGVKSKLAAIQVYFCML